MSAPKTPHATSADPAIADDPIIEVAVHFEVPARDLKRSSYPPPRLDVGPPRRPRPAPAPPGANPAPLLIALALPL